MKNKSSYHFRPLLLSVSLLLACGSAVWAEKADRDKPMNVVADSLKYDDLKQTSQFVGKVLLTKGTLTIRAERVDVRQDPQGYQYGVATGAPGQKAFFRQKREKTDEWLEGEAGTLTYNGKADTISFTQAAVIRRLRGATVTDESAGHTIVYDNTTDTFTIDGGKSAGQATGENAPTGRIRAVLTPQSATRDTGNNAAAPTVTLRPSPSLSSEKK